MGVTGHAAATAGCGQRHTGGHHLLLLVAPLFLMMCKICPREPRLYLLVLHHPLCLRVEVVLGSSRLHCHYTTIRSVSNGAAVDTRRRNRYDAKHKPACTRGLWKVGLGGRAERGEREA